MLENTARAARAHTQVLAVDLGGLVRKSRLHHERAEGVARGHEPAPRLVERQLVVQLDGLPQVRPRVLQPRLAETRAGPYYIYIKAF